MACPLAAHLHGVLPPVHSHADSGLGQAPVQTFVMGLGLHQRREQQTQPHGGTSLWNKVFHRKGQGAVGTEGPRGETVRAPVVPPGGLVSTGTPGRGAGPDGPGVFSFPDESPKDSIGPTKPRHSFRGEQVTFSGKIVTQSQRQMSCSPVGRSTFCSP